MNAPIRDMSEVSVDVTTWVAAADVLCREIAAGAGDPFLSVAELVRELADADLVSIVAPSADGATVAVVAAAGPDAYRWHGLALPVEGTLTGEVLHSGRARLIDDVSEQLGDNVRSISDVAPLLAIPVPGPRSVRAVLTIARSAGRVSFTETDLALAGLFAGQVGLALSQVDERAVVERRALAGERDRLALDMQRAVIAPLFALGMRLQGAAGVTSGVAARQLEAGSDEIDETLKAIRATIYRHGR